MLTRYYSQLFHNLFYRTDITYYLAFYILFNNHDNRAFKILINLQRKGSKVPLAVFERFNMYFIYIILLNKMQKDDALVPGK